MTKTDYMNALSYHLKKLPKNEVNVALAYYSEFFDEAGEENIDAISEKLGAPQDVAKQIISECAIRRFEEPVKSSKGVKNSATTLWIIILAIFASPIAFPLAIALVCVLFVFVLTFLCIVGALLFSGICIAGCGILCIVIGFINLFIQPAQALFSLGGGLILLALGIILCMFTCWIAKLIIIGISKLFKLIFNGGKKHDKIQ